MKTNKLLCATAALVALCMASCGGNNNGKSLTGDLSGNMETYASRGVNAIEQALPQILILPSDQVLRNFGALTEQTVNGRTYLIRDYQKYLLKDDRARRIFSAMQSTFGDAGFPLNDLEQHLKQLTTQEATDMADGFTKDAKTMLLTAVQPDIILELNYDTSRDQISLTSHNYTHAGDKDINYTLSAIDAYTNKVVATITASHIKGESTTETIKKDMNKKLPGFMGDIKGYFNDILTRGRDITVRVTVAGNSNVSLADINIEGDTYADYIIDYIKTNTVMGAYKLQHNTDNELYFVNCRIRLINEDGTQYGVYDWARGLARSMRRDLGVKVANKSQGLGEVLISIEGM